MITAFSPELSAAVHDVYDRPAITLILPFEPKMASKWELANVLKTAAKEVERELCKAYEFEIVDMMMRKLRTVFEGLNYSVHEKSVAIFLSPVYQKVLYLDLEVSKKIIIDEDFSIRDIFLGQQQLPAYLVLALNGGECEVFHFNGRSYARILADAAHSCRDAGRDKFLWQIDQSLSILLATYKMPVFLVGRERQAHDFMKVTKNAEAIVRVIHCHAHLTSAMLGDLLDPYIFGWKQVVDQHRILKIETAAKNNRLAAGISTVWLAAKENNIRHLIVEKSFRGAGIAAEKVFPIRTTKYDPHSEIKDVVDDIIEKALRHAGEVSIVEDGTLDAYGRIVAIRCA